MNHEAWKKVANTIALLGFVVSPSSLHFTAATSQNLLITNGPKDPAHFEVYVNDYESSFEIRPARFDLEPGKAQPVTVILRQIPGSALATDISILAKSNRAGALTFQTGFKVPVSASRKAQTSLTASIGTFAQSIVSHWVLSLLAALLIILGAILWGRKFSSRS